MARPRKDERRDPMDYKRALTVSITYRTFIRMREHPEINWNVRIEDFINEQLDEEDK